MSFPSKSSATASVMKSSKQHTYKKKKASMGGEGHVSGSGSILYKVKHIRYSVSGTALDLGVFEKGSPYP
ncbi:hypothetical protein ACN38_g11395 [Penicillium nordicum]|uniref:Uncharacterized protein n=1 Tax=Penicillium nordicum TaxID=229535 RepID=A0A0M8NYW3_9EURO|nr:hypothetical protein ACN38_g11395 [Penicillium nordicum]